ncbi:MAG: hypothetical protein WD603_01640 [Patescibacteria group bacterium]
MDVAQISRLTCVSPLGFQRSRAGAVSIIVLYEVTTGIQFHSAGYAGYHIPRDYAGRILDKGNCYAVNYDVTITAFSDLGTLLPVLFMSQCSGHARKDESEHYGKGEI